MKSNIRRLIHDLKYHWSRLDSQEKTGVVILLVVAVLVVLDLVGVF